MEKLNKFLIWLHYNHSNITMGSCSGNVVRRYKLATKGDSKFCTCKNKGKAVNDYWDDWHCTYCLKLTEL